MTDADPRDAEPVPAPPFQEEPSTTGVVVADADDDADDDDEGAPAPADQQTALQDAVDRGEAEGSAAAGA
jgi:hypothetical protein